MFPSMIAGFALSFSLILAIGAQNAFVLRQGLRREHVFALCLTCAVSDAILIGVGVAGFGTLAQAAPWFESVMRYGGAAFLTWYGLRNFWSAWQGGAVMEVEGGQRSSLRAAMLTVLAFTWLNPHVYLDTVVLIGSISAQYPDRLGFAIGAITSSFVFFFLLGYGARILSPIFARPRAWQLLDVGIGIVMLAIALKLVIM
ncbi:LysE/ArgO family amino acid transporter [uncultured Ruegeria sp.]|uniref:LysE/ArgO family amino acid transporter n=1 Tax=uncultured Ruegeria sp. TaxID=259304 RepID=UPI002628E07E|nr:LysE/ArgO family amino acid transporter [uncultured Ruegeria sp.]